MKMRKTREHGHVGAMRIRKSLGVLGALAVTAAIVAGCSGGDDDDGGDTGSFDSLTVRAVADWDDFNFPVFDNATSAPLTVPAYDRLVARNQDLEIVPYVAESWTQEPDSITFKIREGVTCADGTPVTPKVIEDSFAHTIEVDEGNLREFMGPGPFSVSSNAQAGTFTWRSETPSRLMLSGFAQPKFGIVCPAGLQGDVLATEMIGSGPYTLASAKHNDEVVFNIREDWNWGPEGATSANLPKTLTFDVVSNDTTAANLLASGELDIGVVAGPDASRLESDDSLTAQTIQNYAPTMMLFNQFEGSQLLDENLRRALASAVDTAEFREAAYDGRGELVTGILPPDSECFDPATEDTYPSGGAEEAERILNEAGYTGVGDTLTTPDGDPVSFDFVVWPEIRQGGEYIANLWRELGVDVTTAEVDQTSFGERFFSSDFGVMITPVDRNDRTVAGQGLTITFGPAPPDGTNAGNTGAADPAYTEAVQTALTTVGEAACPFFATYQNVMNEKTLVFPMVAPSAITFTRGVENVPMYANSFGQFEVPFFRPTD